MEWLQYIMRSEKDHFVPSARKKITNSMLQRSLYLLQPSAAASLDTPLWRTNGISGGGPAVSEHYFLNPLHSAVPGYGIRQAASRRFGPLNHLRFIGSVRVPVAARNVLEKKYNSGPSRQESGLIEF